MAASRAPEEKLLASASESRLYRLGEKSLDVASRVRVEVLRGTLREFAVEADPDLTFVSAWAAENTVTSFERDPAKPGRFLVTLARGVAGGNVEMFWLLERPTGARPADASGKAGKAEEEELRLPDVGLPDFLRGETAVPAGAREISFALAVAAESLSVSTFAAVFASRAQPAERSATSEAANRVARIVTALPCGRES
jgi:hypothetical protein